jgi:hypothetical protein
VADPSFGLYLVFQIVPPHKGPSELVGSFGRWADENFKAPKGWYVEHRKLNLLVVNREFRAAYKEAFPFSLPTGLSGPWQLRGLIRYSAQDVIQFVNFAQLVWRPAVSAAIREGWRLQDFWNEMVEVHVGTEVYITQYMDSCAEALERMTGLKAVKIRLPQKALQDNNESVNVQILLAYRGRLKLVEDMWKDIVLKKGEEDRIMPEFELLQPGVEDW